MNIFHLAITGGLMRRLFENRFAMVETTVAHLNKNKPIWENTPAFVKAVADIDQVVGAIKIESGKQQTPTTGVTATKTQARDALEDTVLETADQLSALAVDQKNPELAAQVEITRSSLDRLSDEELEAFAKRVTGLATKYIAPLADYLVGQDEINELTELTNSFVTLKTAPRSSVVERSSSTAAVPDLLAKASRILRGRIDKLVSRLRETQPEFVAQYRAARVIIDRGGQNTAKEPTVPVPATTPAA